MKETELQKQIISYLRMCGIFARRNNSGAAWIKGKLVRFGWPGSPDIEGIMPGGRYIGIETKTDKGRLSPRQQGFHERIRQLNAVIFVARSIEDVERELSKI